MTTIKTNIHISFVLILFSCCFACTTGTNDDRSRYKDYHVKKDILPNRSVMGSDDFNDYYNYVLPICNGIGLFPMDNGYDSVQIRVWFFEGGSYEKCSMVQLRFVKNKWMGNHYRISLTYPDERPVVVVNDFKVKKVSPENWSVFIDELYKNKIKTLPDSRTLKDYKTGLVTHGGSVFIEYADKQLYRNYSYCSPNAVVCGQPECECIEHIISTISSELDIPEIYQEQLKPFRL